MAEVSVILPNYNHAKYLHERINSILTQTFSDFELIILDDCSTDNSKEVIESYRNDPRIAHIIYNETNSGTTFKQWNKGIGLAAGEFIWIAESDDSSSPYFLHKALQMIKQHPTAGIVSVQSMEIDEVTGKRFLSFSDHPKFHMQFQNSYFNSGTDELCTKLIYENTIPNASGVLFRKSIYYACGGADESLRLCGDWMLWAKMLLVSDFCFIAEPLNYFRLTQISARSRYAWLNTLHERAKVIDFIANDDVARSIAENIKEAWLRRVFKSFPLRATVTAFQFASANSGLLKK